MLIDFVANISELVLGIVTAATLIVNNQSSSYAHRKVPKIISNNYMVTDSNCNNSLNLHFKTSFPNKLRPQHLQYKLAATFSGNTYTRFAANVHIYEME